MRHEQENIRRFRQKRLEAGLCIRCQAALPEGDGRQLCPACRERERVKRIERYQKHVAEGICVACGRNPAADGLRRCAECQRRERAYGGHAPRAVYIAEKAGEDPVVGPVKEIAAVLGVSDMTVYKCMHGGITRGMAGWTIRKKEDGA